MKENENHRLARKNGYGELIDSYKKEIETKERILNHEAYVTWLEQELLYQFYISRFYKNQALYFEERLVKKAYDHILDKEIK